MNLEDKNVIEDDRMTLENLPEALNLNDTKSNNINSKLFSRFAWRRSTFNKTNYGPNLRNFSGNSKTQSNWRSNTRDSVSSESWRSGYSANSSRKWKWQDKQKNETEDSEESSQKYDEEDVSEALNNLFGIIHLDDHTKSFNSKSKIDSSQISWRRNENNSNVEDSSTNSKLESNWRSRSIGESSDAPDSWRTKYNADKNRKWERQKNETDGTDNNEDKWRSKRAIRRNDNEDETSNDGNPFRYRNKHYATNEITKSYRHNEKKRQQLSERNNFENPKSHINLSLRRILKLETEVVPEKVILALIDKIEEFKEIIGGNLSFEDVVLLLRVFDKICSSHFDENRGRLIISIVHGKFLEKILQYLLLLAAQDLEDKNNNMFFWENPEQFWNNLLILYENIFEFMPTTACDMLPKIVKATIISINDAEKYQEIELSTNVKDKLEKFQETLTNCIEKQNQSKSSVAIEPPDSFRLLNIYPTIEEITTREVPFIRTIIKNGAYQSVEHYLDVQFRLLKEDFTASLRNGICTFLQKEENQKSDQFDIRIYEKVQFISPYITYDRVASLLQHTTKIDKRALEESSKRFIYGSLLCFTSNNFEDVSFGTVVDNDIKFLRNGQIIVDIRDGHVDFNKNYTMIECTVFFEPYYQVLVALKKINEDNFPFKDYIIDVTSNTKPPKYIKENTVAHFMFMEDYYKLKILSPETWPKPEQVGLNESQFKAFQSALTQEFCIIQGPPGTGKTYTTLRVVEFLIGNKISLDYTGPIFVICFTNHALDQFLEGILKYTDHILRVGGQSKSSVMQKYGFQKYRQILRQIRRKEELLKKKKYYSRYKHKYSYIHDDFYDSEEDYYYWDEYNDHLNEEELDLDDDEYYFQNYVGSKYYTRSRGSPVYYRYLDELKNDQQSLTDIMSNDGIINFRNFNHLCNEKKFTWFSEKTNSEIIKWLMKFDEKFETENKDQQLADTDDTKEIDVDIYLQLNKLYDERKIIDVDKYLISNHSSYINNFILRELTYIKEIQQILTDMHQLESDNKIRSLIYQSFVYLHQKYLKELNYLRYRLKQSKTQREQIPPDFTIPPEEMTPDERWNYYRSWLLELKDALYKKISDMDDEFRFAHRAHQEIGELEDLYIMKKMCVIGMTTTGAARHQKLLQKLKCPIVIAEEAAEVLESHIVVSLTNQCQHLILIGDHKQLRPNTAQYNLAIKYNLEISLFERMVQNGIHCQQLNIQHRMRPEIAKLIVPAIYPNLENSPTVEDFPPILGVTKNIFFINHSEYEEHVHNSSSHKNIYEAKYLIRFASYLIKQGYSPEEITILTTYKGQMYYLLQEKKSKYDLDEVRITVVDNFQGEENKIILLSLVRSNREANIGFLKIENRVCVALSRAKEGFFIIGNMNNLEKSSKIWPKIKKALVDQDAIGETLTLQCQMHETKTTIRTWEDFAQIPVGGCNVPCNTKLNCDHICKLPCHPYDKEHTKYECTEKCTRTCPREHPCRELCYLDCTPCNILIKTKLACGHILSIPCSLKREEYKCKAIVDATFSCGHTGQKRCQEDPQNVNCLHPCEKLLDCGHIYKFACCFKLDPKYAQTLNKCEKPCTKFKKGCSTNEHICLLKCFEECRPCTDIIKKRRSTCTHKVRVPCNEEIDDTPCRERCRKMLPCGHHCLKLCFEECGNCPTTVKKIIESCGHSIKTECRNAVDRTMCNDQCSQQLKCGHSCKNKCNEPCTEECKVFVTYKDLSNGDLLTNFCYMQPKILT